MRRLAIPPYADRPHRGLVRYLQIAVERATGRAQVVIVANDTTPAACEPLAAALADGLGADLHSLWWNGNAVRTNVILGEAWHQWVGPEALTDRLGGVPVFFPPGAFGQANATVLDALVDAVHRAAASAASVLELYAGVGAFGLGMLARGAHVTFNEVSAHGVSGLRLGLAARSAEERARARVLPGPAEAHVDALQGIDAVVADPPRRGLDHAVRTALAGDGPARVVLVSCDVDALARDVSALTAAGRRLRSLEPLACFPYSDQVETVAVLDAA